IVVPICCYAHVTSDDRSHSSCVVDRPTTSTCPPPTMDFPCEVRSPFLSSSIRWSMPFRSCIWGARSRASTRSCSAVCPPPRAIPLRRTIAIHPIRISATLTGSNTVTAICTIPLGPSRAPRCGHRRTHHLGSRAFPQPRFCARCSLPHGRRSQSPLAHGT
ncbi:hypothetical protein B0H14DRAFT_2989665, partial [Mycena olivaceomarginata]